MKRRAMGLDLVALPGVEPYLAIDLAGDGDHEPERLNVEINDRQLADLLPDALRLLRERLKGP